MQMLVRDMIAALQTRDPELPVSMFVDQNGDAVIEIKLLNWKRTQKVLEKARLNF